MKYGLSYIACSLLLCISTGLMFASTVNFVNKAGTIEINNRGKTLQISTDAPQFIFEIGQTPEHIACTAITGRLQTGDCVELAYPPICISDTITLDIKVYLQYSPTESVLRKWSKFCLNGSTEKVLLKQIILEKIDFSDKLIEMHQNWLQSYPAFTDGFFMGLEFPVANNKFKNNILIISHNPGIELETGVWYKSKNAVFGFTEPGRQKQQFKQYIDAHRPVPHKLHFNYNSWWSAPAPFSENNILDLMKTFKTQLYDRTGVSFDTFCLDMGWSDKQSIWQVSHERFPENLENVCQTAAGMNANLGLWVSPSSHYNDGLDNTWAEANGYEVSHIHYDDKDYLRCCLAGDKYQTAFTKNLSDLVKRFGIGHIKFDGYTFKCDDVNHGHAPEYLSSEKIAQGMITVFEAVRKQAPEIWLETTCMGWDSSPWWLFYVNSVIGTYGTDAPQGRIPCPIYRESYTSARDYFNLQGAARLDIPVAAQEVLGIIHQTDEPFLNDAVTTIMRGHSFLPLYINPRYMNQLRWTQLGSLLTWARDNSDILQQTQPLLPQEWNTSLVPNFTNDPPMPRQPYGYAHWTNNEGLVLLRNPWIVPRNYYLKLDENTLLDPKAKKMSAVSIYPQVRLYARNLDYGDCLDIPLAPYETVVVKFSPKNKLKNVPLVKNCIGGKILASVNQQQIKRILFENKPSDPNSQYAGLLGNTNKAFQLTLKANVLVSAPKAKLLILSEGDSKAVPIAKIKINNIPVPAEIKDSDEWDATHLEDRESWTFAIADVQNGKSSIDIDVLLSGKSSTLSVWLWAADSPEELLDYDDRLPGPEWLSLDSAALLGPTETVFITETETRKLE